jgi:hypothetical protein
MGGTFNLNPFDLLEKLITEHGSAAIIAQQLSFAKEQFAALDRKASEQVREIGKLEAQLQREQLDRSTAQQELQHLQNEHEEDVRIYRCIEFRRGKRTGNKWVAFCPKCHMPVTQPFSSIYALCSDNGTCKWNVRIENSLAQAISELGD